VDTDVKVSAMSATETMETCCVMSHVRGEEREVASFLMITILIGPNKSLVFVSHVAAQLTIRLKNFSMGMYLNDSTRFQHTRFTQL
jgi:hypothetical protein